MGEPADRYQRLKAVFRRALECDKETRDAFLDEACGGDDELRAQVDQLLAADRKGTPLLDRSASPLAAQLLARMAEGDPVERRIGPHRLLREIGGGGMGKVYLAERDDGEFEEQVAIKLIRKGLDTEGIVARFLRERQILANLHHPHIAQLRDGGVTLEGLPYFVMEFIDGIPIDQYCNQRRLTISQRVELFQKVCSAVEAAHRRLIVHCDLKPSNILVTKEGTPKLLDFGIARLADHPSGSRDDNLTSFDRPLTPEYASPEQIRGDVLTMASDVYSLGVVLYKVLTGHLPYRFPSRRRHDIQTLVRKVDPPKPSLAIERMGELADDEGQPLTPARVSEVRERTVGRLRRRLRGDLDSVVLMALQKDPAKRYSTAEQLAADLRRHQDGLPVHARAASWHYRTGKFLRRNWFGLTAAALVVMSLAIGVVIAVQEAREAERQARMAEQQAALSEARERTLDRVLSFMVELFDEVDPEQAGDAEITLSTVFDLAADRVSDALKDEPLARARLMDTIGAVYRTLGFYDLSESFLIEGWELRGEHLPRNHEQSALSIDHLGMLRMAQGRHDEAEPFLQEALEIRRLVHGDRHLETASSLAQLARLRKFQGKYEESESLYREALDIRTEHLGPDDEGIARTLNNLAIVLNRRRNYQEAEGLLRRSLEIRSADVANGHYRAVSSLSNLGVSLRRQLKFQEAEQHFRRAVAILQRYPGATRSEATVLSNLATVLLSQGEKEDAIRQYRESLRLLREILDEQHPDIASCKSNLATALSRNGDHNQAEILLHEVIDSKRSRLGDDHPQLANSLAILGRVCLRQGHLEAAEAHLESALAIQRDAFGAESLSVSKTLAGLADVLRERGQVERAAEVAEQSLAMKQRLGGNELTVSLSKGVLGSCRVVQERFEEAESLLLEALEVHDSTLGSDHHSTQELRARVADLYVAWDRPDEAVRDR